MTQGLINKHTWQRTVVHNHLHIPLHTTQTDGTSKLQRGERKWNMASNLDVGTRYNWLERLSEICHNHLRRRTFCYFVTFAAGLQKSAESRSDRLNDSERHTSCSCLPLRVCFLRLHVGDGASLQSLRPSAPGFALRSAAGQAVGPLPDAAHQRQGFATALLQGDVRHVPVWKADLRGARARVHEVNHTSGEGGFKDGRLWWVTWKMALQARSSASSRRSRSSQPLKYKTHGGRYWVRSAANSCRSSRRRKKV